MLYSPGDRFIPSNKSSSRQLAFGCSVEDTYYSHMIRRGLFSNDKRETILHDEVKNSSSDYAREFKLGLPDKVLDVPMVMDDFYFNSVDWSVDNIVSIALADRLFLYSEKGVCKVGKAPIAQQISGVKFGSDFLAAGLTNGWIELYDLTKNCLIRCLRSHSDRTAALSFCDKLLLSGSKDRRIVVNDLRLRNTAVMSEKAHKGEICVIRERTGDGFMVASGSNDNSVCVWDLRKLQPVNRLQSHKGAVKALAWLPTKANTLFSGGGANDKTIQVWDVNSNKPEHKFQAPSQVAGLVWNSHQNCLISAHGHGNSTVSLWSISSSQSGECKLTHRQSVAGHTKRVLGLCQSPDQQSMCTLGADQTMCVWILKNGEESHGRAKDSKDCEERLKKGQ